MDTPRIFFFINRDYSYPTLEFAHFHGKPVKIEGLFLASGGTISGSFVVRVIPSPMHGRIDLLDQTSAGAGFWTMLTQMEAEIVLAQLSAQLGAVTEKRTQVA